MIRLGIVDFDSSHAVEFTRRFNHAGVSAEQQVDGARVVLGSPGTSEMSPARIGEFTRQIEACGVELVDAAEEMLGRIDAVLVLSLSGKIHLERARPFLEAGMPAFVDKPFACSADDALEMLRLAEEHDTLVYSASALRFAEEVAGFRERQAMTGAVRGAVSYGPAKRAEGNPGLFHYGIHPTEVLLTLMGPGCRRVRTTYTEEAELVTAQWSDGRLATLRGLRDGKTAYGFAAFCERSVITRSISTRYAYRNLCRSIVRTVETGQPEVSGEEMLEVVRFVLASLQSEQSGGEWVELDSVGPAAQVG